VKFDFFVLVNRALGQFQEIVSRNKADAFTSDLFLPGFLF
jgi:hypothetical protein